MILTPSNRRVILVWCKVKTDFIHKLTYFSCRISNIICKNRIRSLKHPPTFSMNLW